MATRIQAETVRQALRNWRSGRTSEVIDSLCPGLTLRVRPRGARWSVRARLHGRQKRWDLGVVVEGDEDVGGVSLGSARAWATEVRRMCRSDQNPEYFVQRVTGHFNAPVEGPRPERKTMLWKDAVAQYLDSLYDPQRPGLATNRPATRRDYAGKLRCKELKPLDGRAVSTVTREEIAEAVAKICARAWPMGAGALRVLKAFFVWLRDPARSRATGVVVSIADLKTPPRPRADAGAPGVKFDPERETRGKTPAEIELGRVLAIARSGVLPFRVGLGVELLLAGVQRRRQTIGASVDRMVSYDEQPGERAWFVPPFFRKTRKGGSRSHLVPIVGFGAAAVDKLCQLAAADGRGWLFPSRVATDDKPADEALLNKWLEAMPGVSMATHGGRYAFASYGPRDLGFGRSEAKLILDHAEGLEPDDVTGRYYSSDPAIARKREMMLTWTDWLEKWCAEAIRRDGLLADREALLEVIFRARYGEERWQQRVAEQAA